MLTPRIPSGVTVEVNTFFCDTCCSLQYGMFFAVDAPLCSQQGWLLALGSRRRWGREWVEDRAQRWTLAGGRHCCYRKRHRESVRGDPWSNIFERKQSMRICNIYCTQFYAGVRVHDSSGRRVCSMQPQFVFPVAVGTNASNAHRRVNGENRVGCPHYCVNQAYGTSYTLAERPPLALAAEGIDRNVPYS